MIDTRSPEHPADAASATDSALMAPQHAPALGPASMSASVPESASAPVRTLDVADAAVSAQDYSFWYGKKQALYGITLNAPVRSITALIGPSGCGKSTFLRSINRMNDLTPGTSHTGHIRLHDDDIYADTMDVVQLRQRVGMVFQRWNPFPKSIYDNVAYGPRINGVRNKAELDHLVEQSLRRATLWDEVKHRLHQSAHGLSGGQQQRLCIARTLANRPEILLLDEPTSALDPISTQKLEELLYELKQEITIIIVTHNLQQAARISDYTAFFYLGKLIEMDTTEHLFTRPREEQTDAYITGRFG